MMCAPFAAKSLIALAVLAASACDPGYRLRPVGWTRSGYEWFQDFDRFSMSTGGLGGLVGEWWLESTFGVFNNSEQLTLKAARLRTARGEYPGTIDARRVTVPPGGGSVSASWRFDEKHTAPDVLGQRAEIALDVEVGPDARTIRIEYERAE